jgi:hypothetical protein
MKKLFSILFVLILTTSVAQNKYRYSDETKKNTGIGLTVGGVAFTAAAILEGGYQYGTYVTTTPATPTSSPKQTYVTPPFWKQTPRNIMFVVGVSLTITGLFSLGSK